MMLQPILVGLKFGFLALLYLFLAWVVVSALRDLRRARTLAADRDGLPEGDDPVVAFDSTPRFLVVEAADDLEPGAEIRVDDGMTVGRAESTDLRIGDAFASGLHARLSVHSGRVYVEDLESTNGTFLNDVELRDVTEMRVGDRLRIGDTVLRLAE